MAVLLLCATTTFMQLEIQTEIIADEPQQHPAEWKGSWWMRPALDAISEGDRITVQPPGKCLWLTAYEAWRALWAPCSFPKGAVPWSSEKAMCVFRGAEHCLVCGGWANEDSGLCFVLLLTPACSCTFLTNRCQHGRSAQAHICIGTGKVIRLQSTLPQCHCPSATNRYFQFGFQHVQQFGETNCKKSFFAIHLHLLKSCK